MNNNHKEYLFSFNAKWSVAMTSHFFPLRATLLLAMLMTANLQLTAQDADSTALRPSFGIEYTGEVQSDFKNFRQANLLHLSADIPLSRKLSFQIGSISALTTSRELDITDVQGYSNIDIHEEHVPFALTVAGFTWQFHEYHSLFAGIRRTDEDYFCSDVLALFTNSSYGIFPTVSCNFPIGTFPNAAIGVHYVFDRKHLRVQASLYNGVGYRHFSGRDNVFRFCPNSDGTFAMAQAEYRYGDSHYYLGGSAHNEPDGRAALWGYVEQALSQRLTLLAAYSRAFGIENICHDFGALGAKYSLPRADLGVVTNYTRIDGIGEWATELLCRYQLTSYLAIAPALHIITTDSTTKCVALLRWTITGW